MLSGLVRKIPLLEAFRAYLYDQLSPTSEHLIAARLKRKDYQTELDISESVSQSTLNRFPDRLKDLLSEYLQGEIEEIACKVQEMKLSEYVRNPQSVEKAVDGEGVPPVIIITRDLRELSYPYLTFDRDDSTIHSLDAFISLLVSAAAHDEFVEEAAENQDLTPGAGSTVPTRRTLQYHLQEFKPAEISRRFTAANSILFEEAEDRGYFTDQYEIAIDITDWAYFGDEDVHRLIHGTKPGRNYTYAFQFASLSLVGTNMPLTMAALPVRSQKNKGALVRRLIRSATEYVGVERAYLDSGFYQTNATRALLNTDTDFVMQAKKNSEKIEELIDEAIEDGRKWNITPHGVGDIKDGRHWLIALLAEKKPQLRTGKPDDPHDNWTVLYMNIEPETLDIDDDEHFEHGAEKLGERSRRRWGIETSYRLIKRDYLPQSRSRETELRLFYFNFAVHLYNIWVLSNIIRADELKKDLSEDKVFTTKRVLQAIDYDPVEIEVNEEPDLSEIRRGSDRVF